MMITEYGKARKRSDGYIQITNGEHRGKLLHRLIYESHYGSIPDGMICHHLDHNKENNAPSNLILLTKSHHHSMHNTGVNNPRWGKGKIDAAGGLTFLSAMKQSGKNMSMIAEDLGYTASTPVYQYLKNRSLRWNEI